MTERIPTLKEETRKLREWKACMEIHKDQLAAERAAIVEEIKDDPKATALLQRWHDWLRGCDSLLAEFREMRVQEKIVEKLAETPIGGSVN